MRPTQGRRIIPTHKLTILLGEITQISLGPELFSLTQFLNNIHHPNSQANFSNQPSSSSFQNSPTEKKLSKLEESMEVFLKIQTAFMKNQG